MFTIYELCHRVRNGQGLRVIPSPRVIGTAQDSVKELLHVVFSFLELSPSFGAEGLVLRDLIIVVYKVWVYLSTTLNHKAIDRLTHHFPLPLPRPPRPPRLLEPHCL